MPEILGIDIGASGIKGNLVDLQIGDVIDTRYKIPTPEDSSPAIILEILHEMVNHFDWKNKAIGIGFPATIRNGVTSSANNISKDWIDFDAFDFFNKNLEAPITIINDADAACLAEVHYGAAKDVNGKVLTITLGTGIGFGLCYNKNLIPNIEGCYLKWKKGTIEDYGSSRAKKVRGWNFKRWGRELNDILGHVDHIYSPDLLVIGGGVSRKFDKFSTYIDKPRCKVVAAAHRNNAGIIGAAAYHQFIH